MADRILAAMDFLDSHTKLVLQKPKQRALGDIDGKYSVVDPLLDISYYPSLKSDVELLGVKKINPSNEKTAEEIVEKDREIMIQSAERARSAPAPYKENPLVSGTRPMTSSSWVTGSLGGKDEDRHIQSMLTLTSASHTSVKRLAFTSPAVHVAPADVRDEVMDEIVNKPLVFKRNNPKSQSAPPCGRIASRYIKSDGTRSAGWLTSPKRARTSLRRRRRHAKSWEKNPGPFMTVKVSGQDLWIVSHSTPTSYFNAKDDGLRENSGMNGTKLPKWEEAAESVPKQEQKSPPRHERLLGAPAQFAPTIQWLRYDPGAPVKKPPVLTPFKSSSDDGKYYNVETTLTNRVNQHLNASPGVRVARNGAVLSHSMKLENDSEDDSSNEGDNSEESEVDVASLIPAKLADKIKRHYSSPEGGDSDSDSQEEKEEEGKEERKNEKSEIIVNDDTESEKSDRERSDTENGDGKPDAGEDSDSESTLSSLSDESTAKENVPTTKLTKNTLSLLTKMTGHNLSNPLLDGSNGSASSDSIDTYELNDLGDPEQDDEDDSQEPKTGHPEGQNDVWRLLESGTPGLWMTKSKQQKLALLKRLRRQRIPENPLSGRESMKSVEKQDEGEEVILPLCWDDEIKKVNAKVVDAKLTKSGPEKQEGNTSLPVVFHKVLRYDRLPAATLSSPIKPLASSVKYRPKSASTQKLERLPNGARPSKGCRAPVSTPRSNRSVRSKSASSTSSITTSGGRGHVGNGAPITAQSLDLADLLRVTPDSFPTKNSYVTTQSHVVKKERVTIVHNDVSEREMNTVRKVAAQSMLGNADRERREPVKGELATAGGIFSSDGQTKEKSFPLTTVETLNLSSVDADNSTTIGTTPLTLTTQRRSEERPVYLTNPQNTPKTPIVYRSPMLTPKTSARGLPASAIHFPANIVEDAVTTAVEMTHDGRRATDQHTQRQNGVNASVSQVPQSARSILSGRSRGGFAANPLTQSRLKSAASKSQSGHFGASVPNGTRIVKGVGNDAKNQPIDGAILIPSIQMGNGSDPTTPYKPPDFIQITQSLHISQRAGGQLEAHAITGNKVYDSYMRELAANGEYDDGRAMIVCRGLGGTPGKTGMSLSRSAKRNLGGYRHQQSHNSPQIMSFAPQAGRRSGLAMVHDKSQHGGHSQSVGPFGLGVKGDQVRLNLDKNINVIYRDLGIFKQNGNGKPEPKTPSPGRSHLSSAKSRSQQKEESVISIPTASNGSVADAVTQKPSGTVIGQIEGVAQQGMDKEYPISPEGARPSSSDPSVSVQDSGTQWSSRTQKDSGKEEGDGDTRGSNSTTKISGQDLPPTPEYQTLALNLNNLSTEPSTTRSVDTDKQTVEQSPDSAQTTGKVPSQSSGPEGSAATQSLQPAVTRSASETLLDKLAELGEQVSDVTEDEEENEDENVHGVTRVTVNIPDVK